MRVMMELVRFFFDDLLHFVGLIIFMFMFVGVLEGLLGFLKKK